MFEHLAAVVPDPILGLMAAFRADPEVRKVDLGVGVYRDGQGNTPVLESVRAAESALIARQTTKSYVGPRAIRDSTSRWNSWCLAPRIRRSPPGGCAACRHQAAAARCGSERS